MFWNKNKETEKILDFRGHTLYSKKEAAELPMKRSMAYLAALDAQKWSMGEDDLTAFLDLISELNVGDHPDKVNLIGWAINTIRTQANQDLTRYGLFLVAEPFILIDDEPFHELSAKHTALKKELFLEYEEIRDFFLSIGAALLQASNPSSITSQSLDSLKEQQARLAEQLFLSALKRATMILSEIQDVEKYKSNMKK